MTDPLTDEELAECYRVGAAVEASGPAFAIGAPDAFGALGCLPRLLAELDRLTRRCEAQAAELERMTAANARRAEADTCWVCRNAAPAPSEDITDA